MTQTATHAGLLVLDAQSFHKTLKESEQPVLVDFWAPWCGPCRTVGPHVEALALEHGDRIRVAKVNLDENPTLAGELGISSIPTFLKLEDGEVADRLVGAVSKDRLRRFMGL